jgi:hypothetical protein
MLQSHKGQEKPNLSCLQGVIYYLYMTEGEAPHRPVNTPELHGHGDPAEIAAKAVREVVIEPLKDAYHALLTSETRPTADTAKEPEVIFVRQTHEHNPLAPDEDTERSPAPLAVPVRMLAQQDRMHSQARIDEILQELQQAGTPHGSLSRT